MDEVITEANILNSSVRGHAFPALESGNISFPNGRYVVGFEGGADNCSFTVHHRIEGAALIERAIDKGLAEFVCTVASPISSYRTSHRSASSIQKISWESDDLGEPPMFTPMVIVAKPFEWKLERERDEIHQLWDGLEVAFKRGMRLALSDVVLMRSSVLNMLLFQVDRLLQNGEFRVEAEPREGFGFRVHLAPDLHSFLRYDLGDPSRAHILTHVATACFGVLKSDWQDDDEDEGGWRSYRGLQTLADTLEEYDVPHWTDDDFSPELAATRLYPHHVSVAVHDENED